MIVKLLKRLVDYFGFRFAIQRMLFNLNRSVEYYRLLYRFKSANLPKRVLGIPQKDLLIISPYVDPVRQPWVVGGGNYFFEIYHSAVENLNDLAVTFLQIDSHQTDWLQMILEDVQKSNPRNILLQIEVDPDGSNNWNIDVLAVVLRKSGWKGKLFLLSYDSVYPLHMYRIDRVCRLAGNCVVISIDRDCSRDYRTSAKNISTVFLPISSQSITHINKFIQETSGEPIDSLTFVGAEYGYRRKLLQELSLKGIEVVVNPQNTRGEPSNYCSYIRTLNSSLATLNFSRAHVIDIPQLKSRVIEAMLFNCVIVTDDSQVLQKYFTEGIHFLRFSDSEMLSNLVEKLKTNPCFRESVSISAQTKATLVNREAFWGPISQELS